MRRRRSIRRTNLNTQVVGNLQITYQATPRVTLQLLGVNIYNNCFGGTKAPWITDKKTGCWYTAGGQYTGNFFNPGDTIQPFTAFPYQPTFGNVFQQAYGGEASGRIIWARLVVSRLGKVVSQ